MGVLPEPPLGLATTTVRGPCQRVRTAVAASMTARSRGPGSRSITPRVARRRNPRQPVAAGRRWAGSGTTTRSADGRTTRTGSGSMTTGGTTSGSAGADAPDAEDPGTTTGSGGTDDPGTTTGSGWSAAAVRPCACGPSCGPTTGAGSGTGPSGIGLTTIVAGTPGSTTWSSDGPTNRLRGTRVPRGGVTTAGSSATGDAERAPASSSGSSSSSGGTASRTTVSPASGRAGPAVRASVPSAPSGSGPPARPNTRSARSSPPCSSPSVRPTVDPRC